MRNDIEFVNRLIKDEEPPPEQKLKPISDAPDSETAVKWEQHRAMMARQKEDKRLREIARDAEQKKSIKGLEHYGKRASNHPTNQKGHSVGLSKNRKHS